MWAGIDSFSGMFTLLRCWIVGLLYWAGLCGWWCANAALALPAAHLGAGC